MTQHVSRTLSYLVDHGRLAEWCTSASMLSFAMILALPGDSIRPQSTWAAFDRLLLSDATLAVPVAIVSVLRMAALYANGRYGPQTQYVRLAGAVLGTGFFLAIAGLFYLPYIEGVTPSMSTAVGTYSVLAITDLISAWRAGADARIAQCAES